MPRKSKARSTDLEDEEVAAQTGRGLVLRVLLHSPKDTIAATAACVAITAVVANALFLQAGRHPSPMFGAAVAFPLPTPVPKPRPVEQQASVRSTEPRNIVEAKPADRPPDAKPADAKPSAAQATASAPRAQTARAQDSLGDLINSTRRTATVQRVLTEFGYGQLKASGNVGSDTQAAIQRFERERRLPVTGQVSDRLVRELAAATGREID